MPENRSLTRNMAYRRVAGVCAGLADFFGVDVTLIRILFVLSVFFGGGVGLLVYLVCWVVLPKDRLTNRRPLRRSPAATVIFLVIVAAVAAGWAWDRLDRITTWGGNGLIAPVVFIALVGLAWLVLHRRRTARQRRSARSRPTHLTDTEPSAREAPPTYLGGDPLLRIDSFYPSDPYSQSTPGSYLPPYGDGLTGSGPAEPPYRAGPATPLDPGEAPSGFQPQ